MRGWLTLTVLWLEVIGSVVTEVTKRTLVTEDDGQSDSGYPLYLTRLIKSDNLQQARDQSRVSTEWTGGVISYAGYITVNATYDSHLFFWLFEAQKRNAPLLLWLNGGPGVPSTVGALLENGPLEIIQDEAGKPQMIRRRKGAWTTEFNMLYVDSPLGTGYSFTKKPAGQPDTMEDVVHSLHSLLTQLYQMFPVYKTVDLYIGGQSYAGKYVPALGKYVHDRNEETPAAALPFRGIYVGGGLSDPETMFPEFADNLYYAGLISNRTRYEHADTVRAVMQNATEQGYFTPQNMDAYMGKDLGASEAVNYDNMMGVQETVSRFSKALGSFMNSSDTKRQLHVGDVKTQGWSDFNITVFLSLTRLDMFVHTRKETAFLMDNYKVLLFSGNLDMTVTVSMTEAFLSVVPWSGRQQYQEHVRNRWWKDDKTMLGWVYKIGKFVRVVVRNAGHQVPYNQPEAALQMMTNFVFDLPFRGDPVNHQDSTFP